MIATAEPTPVTAEVFLQLHGDDSGVELVDGQIVKTALPGFERGDLCMTAGVILATFVKSNRLGRVLGNDTFIRTKSKPERSRGADICYVSHERYAKDLPRPKDPVRSLSDSILDMTNKAMEYLAAGVKVMMVINPKTESAAVDRADESPLRFHNRDKVVLPDILPGFSVPVAKILE